MADPVANVDAEQALLGALLINNGVLDVVSGIVRAEHFADPLHARVWQCAAERIRSGAQASVSLLAPYFRDDEGMAALGGVGYLARLAGAAISVVHCKDYAAAIADASLRRELQDMTARAAERVTDFATPCADIMASLEGELLALGEAPGAGADQWLAGAVKAAMDDVWEAYQSECPLMGVSSGLPSLDKLTGGWKPGRLIILAGRPGMGKSAVALFFAWAAASAGHGVQFSSLEMSEAEVSARLVSLQTWRRGLPVQYETIMRAEMSEREAECVAKSAVDVSDLPIRITGPKVRDLGAIAAAARRSQSLMAAKQCTLDMVIVDYLGLVKPPRERNSKVNEIGDITGGFKMMARTLNVPVMVLSQLSRGVESRDDKRPMMSDLRDSGDIEQDADQILFPYRHEYYEARTKPQDHQDQAAVSEWMQRMDECRNLLEIDVAKNRQGRSDRLRFFCAMNVNAVSELAQ
jgi:replicative DNA helicase